MSPRLGTEWICDEISYKETAEVSCSSLSKFLLRAPVSHDVVFDVTEDWLRRDTNAFSRTLHIFYP